MESMKTIVISSEDMEQIKACIDNKKSFESSLAGSLFGGSLVGVPLIITNARISKTGLATIITVGAVYGYAITKYLLVKDCIAKVLNIPKSEVGLYKDEAMKSINMYGNAKHRLKDQELVETEPNSTTASLFDTEGPPQSSLFDEFPTVNESAPFDEQERKEPERTITYDELRQKNREKYRVRHTPIRASDQKERDVFFELSTGEHKTKYGDVWD